MSKTVNTELSPEQ